LDENKGFLDPFLVIDVLVFGLGDLGDGLELMLESCGFCCEVVDQGFEEMDCFGDWGVFGLE
jgi:hypothetical protein